MFLAVLAITLSVQPMMAAQDKAAPKANQISLRKTMSKSSEYVDKYAEAAMEQMRRYGIPASVTLAQGILESGSGQSELSRKGNNHFGIRHPHHGWRAEDAILSIPMTSPMRSSASTLPWRTATSIIPCF